tara:strand:+ start:265 stop:390 length:126 start_codon:yes stop_codon:yes gene_type:complete
MAGEGFLVFGESTEGTENTENPGGMVGDVFWRLQGILGHVA